MEHGGLPCAGGTDDHEHEHETILAGDRSGRFGLHRIQLAARDGGGGLGWVDLVVDRPGQDVFFLGEDVVAGVVACGRLDPHRPTIRPATPAAVGRIQVDTVVEDGVDGPVEELRPALAVDTGAGADGVAEVLDDVEAMPRRPPLPDRCHHLAD